MPSILFKIAGAALLVLAGACLWLFTLGPYRRVDADVSPIPTARPALFGSFGDDGPIANDAEWRRRRALLLEAFETNVYGRFAPAVHASVRSRTAIASSDADGVAGVEQWQVSLGDLGSFNLVLVMPPREGPAPVIIMQNFCGNRAAFPNHSPAIAEPVHFYPWHCHSPLFRPVHQAIYGQWIDGPPFQRITARGYALALFYGGDLVPDRAEEARTALARLGANDSGALAAWAWMQSRIVDVLSADPRIDSRRIVAWGQSRYGKAALLAGASDGRIAAVVALQSGRGGDALTTHRAGESVRSITTAYPHWFSPRFATFSERDPPIDQHQLIALIAPRALLLGYADRDGWSDPPGAIAAMRDALPAYRLLGAAHPEFYLRSGRHGVSSADWTETLNFLDRRLGRGSVSAHP